MEVAIKVEENKTPCSTCMDIDCQMFQVGSLIDIYQIILNCQIPVDNKDNVLLCIQCFNFLTTVKEFQHRAWNAQNVLKVSQNNDIGSLTLSSTEINTSNRIEILLPKDEVEDIDQIHNDDTYKDNLDEIVLLPNVAEGTSIKDKGKNDKRKIRENKESKLNVKDEINDFNNIYNDESNTLNKNSLSPLHSVNIANEQTMIINEKLKEIDDIYNLDDNSDTDIDDKDKLFEINDKPKKKKYINKWNEIRKKINKQPKFILTKDIDVIFYKSDDVNESKVKKNLIHTDLNVEKDRKELLTNVVNAGSYICKACGLNCAEHEREAHIQNIKVHKDIFQCIQCELVFGRRREFFLHYKRWHMHYICDHCGVSFRLRDCMKKHMRKQHLSATCKICSKKFPRYHSLWLHIKRRHSQADAVPAYCVECDSWYPDHYHYQRHLATSVKHNPKEKRRIPCPDCDKIFTRKLYMTQHRNVVHLQRCKFKCDLCDKNFLRSSSLQRHKRGVHDGIAPPKNRFCYVCGRGFSNNRILQNHLRTHTGERPYACDACPARFTQETALKTHQRALHADDTVKTNKKMLRK